jgi:hypothetical protein
MTEAATIALSFAAGAAVGAAYLGLLWVSVRYLLRGRSPALFLGLAALRAGLFIGTVAGVIALGAGLGAIAALLLGFVTVRVGLTRSMSLPRGGGV